MPGKVVLSKAFAVAFAVLTASAIAGMITMITVYQIEISGMNVTRPPTVPTTTMAPRPVMRLPRNLIPERYKIFIQPHIYTRIVEVVNVTTPNQTLIFTGNSTVHLHCVQGTRRIYLHSRDLVVSDPRVTNRNTGEAVDIATFTSVADEKDFLEIELEESLRAGGNYSLFLAFQGDVSENLETLYLSKYTEIDRDSENETIAER